MEQTLDFPPVLTPGVLRRIPARLPAPARDRVLRLLEDLGGRLFVPLAGIPLESMDAALWEGARAFAPARIEILRTLEGTAGDPAALFRDIAAAADGLTDEWVVHSGRVGLTRRETRRLCAGLRAHFAPWSASLAAPSFRSRFEALEHVREALVFREALFTATTEMDFCLIGLFMGLEGEFDLGRERFRRVFLRGEHSMERCRVLRNMVAASEGDRNLACATAMEERGLVLQGTAPSPPSPVAWTPVQVEGETMSGFLIRERR